ncbi:MAG: class I SAM-dependent methyltransferase [Candidatus Gracilibacteria bacterium]|nr:class I SAM-dependent methyltransferase [Candidatus Gracilibacteria bacterium]
MYENFAKYYDKLMGDRSNYIVFIDRIIIQYNLNPKNILDIACGTGKILSKLNDNYTKYGVDLSENMLEIAKKNVVKGIFYKQDMRELHFDIMKFDFVTCLFDSINHLVDFSDWEKVFNKSYDLLNTNGIFLFDINTKTKLEKVSKYKPIMYEIGNDIIFFTTEDKGNGIVKWNIKFFENTNGNNFNLFHENIEENSFKIDKIKKSLNKFSKIIIVDENFNIANDNSDRIFFICIK